MKTRTSIWVALLLVGCGGLDVPVAELDADYRWSYSVPDGESQRTEALGDEPTEIEVEANTVTFGAVEIDVNGVESRSAYAGAQVITVTCPQETAFHLLALDGAVWAVSLRCQGL